MMLLQAQFSEDQLFINSKSYYTQPINNVTCEKSNNILQSIYTALNSVFFFEINIDVLLLNDPYGNVVMSFQRVVLNTPANITGIWNMNQFGNTQTSLSVQISNTQITLCQGNLIYNYTLASSKNSITLNPILSSCPSQNLTNAVSASRYFRLNNGILNLYDSKVTLTAGLVYSTVFDPAKPIFGGQTTTASTAAPSLPQTAISTSNLVGSWSILSLFNIPFSSSAYTLTFTATAIKITGGCSNYTLNYTLNSTTQIITISNSTPSVSSACSQSDDQLYISGVVKMYKYLLSNSNGVYTLSIYDQSGNIGYSLRLGTVQSNSQSSITASNSLAVATPSTPLSPGTYLLLLLQRRDLARLLVNVTSNILVYKGCNNIQQAFTPTKLTANQANISFTGGPTTNNTCPINNDKTYYETLNLAQTYTYDSSAGAVILSNSNGVQIATLSQAS
jgi:hypothetical protein